MTRTRSPLVRVVPVAVAVAALLMPAAGALAQQPGSGGFLDNLFNPGQGRQPVQQSETAPADSSVSGRIARIENALRQLTGTIEELQHQNRQLQLQLKRLQDDTYL